MMLTKISLFLFKKSINSKTNRSEGKKENRDTSAENDKELIKSVNHGQKNFQHVKKQFDY